MNIEVFASNGGSDLQAIIDGCINNQINTRVLDMEHEILIEVIADIVDGKIKLG